MKFKAEIKEIKQRKMVSLDNEYSIRLVTDDSKILDLGKLPPDVIVDVEIRKEGKKNG